MNYSVKSIFVFCVSTLLFSSCTIMNSQGSADDDLYFSTSNNLNNGYKKIPTIYVEKIKRDFPSQVDSTRPAGYNLDENTTPNPRAVNGYPAYNAEQDSIYKSNPQYSGYYQPYKMPAFSLRDEYLNQKAQLRQQRRLARINRRNTYGFNNYNNYGYNNGYNSGYNSGFSNWGGNYGYNNWGGNYGYNNNNFCTPWYGYNRFGYNNWGPSFNFGWNSYNGWNTGIGFGYNNWGGNNFYNPWGYNNYYSPFYGYNNSYYPYYPNNYNNNNGNNGSEPQKPSNSQPRPREVVGSNLPATNGGTLDNPNPLRTTMPRSSTPNEVNPNPVQPNQSRSVGNGATLINTPNGQQYIAPRSNEVAPPTYSTFEKSREVNQNDIEYRKANPQYIAPVETPRQNNSNSQSNNTNEPRSNQFFNSQPNQNQTRPTFNQQNNSPRSNGSFSGGSMNSGGGGGGGGSRSSGGGGGGGNGGGGGGGSRPR